jgi:quaternary ammonium compound-resistance protein SugE
MVRGFAIARLKLSRDFRSSSERMPVAWVWLIMGGVFEVGFTTALRFVDGFRNLPWTIAFLVSVTISMALLELASRSIAMGTAYAVWGGIGAVGTVVVGIAFFNEPAALVRILLIFGIVAAIAGLKLTA